VHDALGVTKRGKNPGPLVVVLTQKIRTTESRERSDDAPGVCVRIVRPTSGVAETGSLLLAERWFKDPVK
jgi:hypothetical protein